MDVRDVVRRSRNRLSQGREVASNRLSSALSMVNLVDMVRTPQNRDSRGWTVLHMAARHSKPQTVRLVIEQGGRVADKDEEGNTPLHFAAESGNKDAARVLLHHGASITDRNNTGLSPLHVGAKNSHDGLVSILLQHTSMVDMPTTTGVRTALHIASSQGATEVTRVLLTAGANPRARATLDWTALHFSAREGHLDTTKMLVIKGAKIDAVTTGGWTPLMFASSFNKVEVVKYLMSKGAQVRLTNADGLSAEVIAAGKGYGSLAAIIRGDVLPLPGAGGSPASRQGTVQEAERCMVSVNEFLHEEIEDNSVSCETEDSSTDSTEEFSDVLELMSTREVKILDELKHELDEKIHSSKNSEKEFKEKVKSKEANLNDVKIQLGEAQELEETLRRDLKRVTKDIEVLEKRNIEIRNEMTTESRQYQNTKDISETKIRDCREKISQYINDTKEKIKERSKESPAPLNKSDKYNSIGTSYECLNIESELECPICFELSRPPIYQCPEGHIICNACRPRVSRCPVCRFVFQGMPDIRNRFIEKLANTYFNNEK